MLLPTPPLQPMTATHLDEVAALERRAYAFPWTRGNFVDALAAGHWAQAQRAPDGTLTAYIVALPGVQEMHLLNLTVAPTHRRQRLATALMQALVHEAQQRHARTLWLEVRSSNTEAMALYMRLGFTQRGVRRGYYPAAHSTREDALVLAWDVAEPVHHHAA